MASVLTITKRNDAQMAHLRVVVMTVTLGADASAGDYVESGLAEVVAAFAQVDTTGHAPVALKCVVTGPTHPGRVEIFGANATTANSLQATVVALGF